MFSESKKYAQAHRQYLADPRTVSGFNPEWKEMHLSFHSSPFFRADGSSENASQIGPHPLPLPSLPFSFRVMPDWLN